MWAARYEHEEVLLLRQMHAQPDVPDMRNGRKTFPRAARSGHEGMVRQFLSGLFVDLGNAGSWEER